MRAAGKIWVLGFLLVGCVGGTLSNKDDLEMYPLRAATEAEGTRLKHCLDNAHKLQERRMRKTGKYYRRTVDMPLDSFCQGFLLAQTNTPEGYEILAQFHEDEQSVRWSVNENGEIDEHLDAGDEYEDLEF